MSSVNRVILIGNLGKDPEAKHFDNGGTIVQFPLATKDTFKNRDGDKVERTEWHNISVRFPKLAEVCEKYLRKGHKIYLEGSLRTRQYEEGGSTRYFTEVIMENMTMLTTRAEAEAMAQNQGNPAPAASSSPSATSTPPPKGPEMESNLQDDDDLPF